jgi:hypothetical protein
MSHEPAQQCRLLLPGTGTSLSCLCEFVANCRADVLSATHKRRTHESGVSTEELTDNGQIGNGRESQTVQRSPRHIFQEQERTLGPKCHSLYLAGRTTGRHHVHSLDAKRKVTCLAVDAGPRDSHRRPVRFASPGAARLLIRGSSSGAGLRPTLIPALLRAILEAWPLTQAAQMEVS